MTTWQPPTPRDQGSASRRPTSASSAYWGGQKRPMRARNDAELGEAIRNTLWRFAARTGLRGVRRDQAALSLIRNRFPAARDAFPDQAIAAAIREVTDGTCHFCALRVLTAAADTSMPERPTPGLVALLGKPCRRCEGEFATGEALKRERRLLASGLRRPSTEPARQSLPSYYRPGRPR